MKKKMSEALSQCLDMAMTLSSESNQFVVKCKAKEFTKKIKYKVETQYSKQAEHEEEEGLNLKKVA